MNKSGHEKKYEIVSRRELQGIEDVGGKPSGVSIVATCEGKLLLLLDHEITAGFQPHMRTQRLFYPAVQAVKL